MRGWYRISSDMIKAKGSMVKTSAMNGVDCSDILLQYTHVLTHNAPRDGTLLISLSVLRMVANSARFGDNITRQAMEATSGDYNMMIV